MGLKPLLRNTTSFSALTLLVGSFDPQKTVPEMTYNVFSGTLNPTHFTSPTQNEFLATPLVPIVFYSGSLTREYFGFQDLVVANRGEDRLFRPCHGRFGTNPDVRQSHVLVVGAASRPSCSSIKGYSSLIWPYLCSEGTLNSNYR